MKYLKVILSAVFALAIGFGAAAAEEENITCLIFHFTNGTTESYNLPDKPIVTFEGEKINIAGNAITASWNRADIEYFNFETQKLSGLETACTDEKAFTFSFIDNNNITVAGNNITSIAIYDINGRCAIRSTVVDNMASVSVATLSPGIYIVEIPGHHSVKIIKR